MTLRHLLDPLLRRLLRLGSRARGRREGVLLVSSRGPAEMVFLSAVLPRFMRLARDGEPVTLICRPDAAGMSFLFPRTLRLKRIDPKRLGDLAYRWQLFREMYRANFRVAVSLDHTRDAEFAEPIIGATEAGGRATIAGAGVKGPYTHLIDCGSPDQDKIFRWSRYADELLDDRQPPELALIKGVRLPAALKLPPTAVLMPFSGVRQRQVPVEMWRLIISRLPPDWDVRVAGHRTDFERNPQYALLMKLPHVAEETGDFERLTSVLRGSRLVIGVDTAALHLAALLGVPTLCLASAAYVGAGVPYDERVAAAHVHFLYTPMDCQGCLGRCRRKLQKNMFPCIADFDPDEVMGAVRDILARGAV